MDRRTFLKSGGVAAAATATGAVSVAPSLAAPAIGSGQLKIRTALGPQFQKGYLRDRADRLALSLRNLSSGRVEIQFVETGDGVVQRLDGKDLQAYFGSEAEHLGTHPSFGFFAGLPGDQGLRPDDYKIWLSGGGGQLHWDAIAAEFGFKPFAVGHSGAAGLWSNTDLVLLEHLQGKRLFASGLTALIGQGLGLQISGTLTAADAIELPVGQTAALADGHIGQSKFWFADGIARNGHVLSFGLSLDLWEQLSDSDKALIEICTAEAYHQCVSEQMAHDREVAPVLLAHRGIQRRQWQDEVRRAIEHLSTQAAGQIAESSKESRDLYENYMYFRQSVKGNGKINTSVGLV